MLLINILVICDDKPPTVISICDCTDYMVDGGKKMLSKSWIFLNQRLMNLIQQKYTLILFLWWSCQCAESRVNTVCPLSTSNMLSWWGACTVTVIQWSIKAWSFQGKDVFYSLHFFKLTLSIATCFESMQTS